MPCELSFVRSVREHAFVQELDSNAKGNIAEAAIAFEAMKLGIGVLKPQTEHTRYDLALEVGNQLLRVQCKWARLHKGVVVVTLATCRHTPLNGYVRSKYASTEVDAVAAYCGELERCFFFPIALLEGRSAIYPRLTPARNNQRAAVNFAADYEFKGAVAQLEERRNGIAKARGSSPLSSTRDDASPIGAEEFGKSYARFLQRAAGGEEFLITRRGTAMARLSPPESPRASAQELGGGIERRSGPAVQASAQAPGRA